LGWIGSLDHYRLGLGGPSAEDDQVEDGYFGGWEWAWDTMELEIPEEVTKVSPESTANSKTPSSIPTVEDRSSLQNHSPVEWGREGPSNNDVRPSLASSNATSAAEWFCKYSNCGQFFTHRHQLKYVYDTP